MSFSLFKTHVAFVKAETSRQPSPSVLRQRPPSSSGARVQEASKEAPRQQRGSARGLLKRHLGAGQGLQRGGSGRERRAAQGLRRDGSQVAPVGARLGDPRCATNQPLLPFSCLFSRQVSSCRCTHHHPIGQGWRAGGQKGYGCYSDQYVVVQ